MNKNTRCTINGIQCAPQELEVAIQAVDYDSGRTADGTMHRNMVGEKRKYTLAFPPIHTNDTLAGNSSGQKMKDLILAVTGTEHVSFPCTFPDPITNNGMYTGEFYVGDRTFPIYNFALDIWDAYKFDLIEM